MNIGVTGKNGEDRVAAFLRKQGCNIIKHNHQCRFGEIDIIAANRKYLVFAEVKLRKSDKFAKACEFVDVHKQQRLRTTAELYLSENPTKLQPRFDVIEVYAPNGILTDKPVIVHLEDAF